jgi:type IV pilus assembly protein PilF
MAGCVTQSYEDDAETPVIENTATNNEIALTRISLGLGYLNIGNTIQAKLNLEKAKNFAPHLTQVYTAFAQYYDVVDEPEQAILAFEHALSIDANDPDTLNNYGVFLCKRERYDESEAIILKAIAVPSYLLVSQSYENLALCQLENRKFEKAEMYLAKAISHSPSRASTLLQMLRLQYVMGNYDETIAYLKRYEKSVRRFTPNALALAYKAYEKRNNQRIAKNYAGMLVKMFPNSYESNQYILNGLQHIEADDLATEFLFSHGQNKKSKKRVMVLSPNKKSGISLAATKNLTNALKDQSTNNSTTNLIANESEQANKKVAETLNVSLPDAAAKEKVDELKKKKLAKEIQAQETVNFEIKDQQGVAPVKSIDRIVQASVDDHGNRMLNLPIHVVVNGDSLYSISKRYNIQMHLIERWNGFKRSKILNIGDVIYLANPKKSEKFMSLFK